MSGFQGSLISAPYYGNMGGAGPSAGSVQWTPAGPVGTPQMFAGIPPGLAGENNAGRLRSLFGDPLGSVLGNFFTRGPIGQQTIEEQMYGQILVSTTSVATYKAVVGQGNWAIQRLAQYHLTYVHRVMQRYYYYRMYPARRTGHLDMQASGTESMFSFQRTGHRVGATAHARAEELFGPEDLAKRKRNWMIDQIVYGHMATHQHDIIAAVYMESLIRDYILSGGNRWTNEKYVEWELLEAANVFGCLNDHPQYAAPKLLEYASRVDGTIKIGILPRKALRMHQNLLPTKIDQAIGRIALDTPVQITLGLTGVIERSVAFPTDATLDPYSQPRAFGNINNIEIYLEPSSDLNTGNSDTNTLLVNHHPVPEFYRHGLIRGGGGHNINPNVVRIYDIRKPGLNTVNPGNRAGILATGVFTSKGAPAPGNGGGNGGNGPSFPSVSDIYAGFSPEFHAYIKKLNDEKFTSQTNGEYRQQGATAFETVGFYSEEDSRKDLVHCLASIWPSEYPRPADATKETAGWSPAPVIGAMMPHSLRHQTTLDAVESINKLVEPRGADKRTFFELASEIVEVATFFNNLPFNAAFWNDLYDENGHVANDGVNELKKDASGAYKIPAYKAGYRTGYLFGYGAGPLLRSLVNANLDLTALPTHERMISKLRSAYSPFVAMLTTLASKFKNSATLATNLLPDWYDKHTCTVFDAWCASSPIDAHCSFGTTGPSSPLSTDKVALSKWVQSRFFINGVFLLDSDAVDRAGNEVTRFSQKNATVIQSMQAEITRRIPSIDTKTRNAMALLAASLAADGPSGGGFPIATSIDWIKDLSDQFAKAQDKSQFTSERVESFMAGKLSATALATARSPAAPAAPLMVRTMLNFTYADLKRRFSSREAEMMPGDPETNCKTFFDLTVAGNREKAKKYYVDNTDPGYLPSALRELKRDTQATQSGAATSLGANVPSSRSGYAGSKIPYAAVDADYAKPDLRRAEPKNNTAVQQVGLRLYSSHHSLILWRMRQFFQMSGSVHGHPGFFLWLTYILTPITLDSMATLAETAGLPLPFDLGLMRWCQVFLALDMLFARAGCVQVLQTPLMTFLYTNGPGQQITLNSKVMSNEFVERPSDVIRVPNVYVVDMYHGRGIQFITPADSKAWTVDLFRRRSELRNIVVVMERHHQNWNAFLYLNNKYSQSLKTAQDRGALAFGYWTSSRFTVEHSHAKYFSEALGSYKKRLSALPKTQSNVQNFFTKQDQYRFYNYSAGVDFKAHRSYINLLAFRGMFRTSEAQLGVGSIVRQLPDDSFTVFNPACTHNPIGSEKWNSHLTEKCLQTDASLHEIDVTRTEKIVY